MTGIFRDYVDGLAVTGYYGARGAPAPTASWPRWPAGAPSRDRAALSSPRRSVRDVRGARSTYARQGLLPGETRCPREGLGPRIPSSARCSPNDRARRRRDEDGGPCLAAPRGRARRRRAAPALAPREPGPAAPRRRACAHWRKRQRRRPPYPSSSISRTLASEQGPPPRRCAARLYRLRAVGAPARRGAAAAAPRAPGGDARGRSIRCARGSSGIDGSGSRAAWILLRGRLRRRPAALLPDPERRGGGSWTRRAAPIARQAASRRSCAGPCREKPEAWPWVEVDGRRACALVADALALHERPRHGCRPPSFARRWRRLFAAAAGACAW